MRILFVDDNAFNQRVGQMKLEPRGHQVRLASSGAETLRILESERFDVLLLDMQMPDMDGLEVTRRIRMREAANGARLPIIAVTAHTQEEIRAQCTDAGMDSFVTKPIKDEQLWQAIRDALKRKGDIPGQPVVEAKPAEKERPATNEKGHLERALNPGSVEEDQRCCARYDLPAGARRLILRWMAHDRPDPGCGR